MHYILRDKKTQKYADRRSNWREKISWTTDSDRVFVHSNIFEMANHIRTIEGFGIDVSTLEMVSIDEDTLQSGISL